MNVEFNSKARRTFVKHGYDSKTYRFDRGRYVTADKDEIQELLSSTEKERGDIWVNTPIELVNEYLDSGEPDRLTEEVLDSVTSDGLAKLADHLGLKDHGYHDKVIKIMAEGKYIDDRVAEILNEYEGENSSENLLERALEAGVITYDQPWYKFSSPESTRDEPIERSKAKVEKWCIQNKETLNEALDHAENTETDEQESE